MSTNTHTSPEEPGAALLRCLRFRPEPAAGRPLIRPDDVERISLLAETRLGPLIGWRLDAAGWSAEDPASRRLVEAYRRNSLRNLILFRELEKVAAEFRRRKLPLMVLKGAHLALAAYEQPGARFMGDLDLMVPLDRLEPAAAALRELGFSPVRPYALRVELDLMHHLPRYRHPGTGVAIELHWSLGGREGYVDPSNLEEIRRRAASLELPGKTAALAMSDEDLLLYVSLHATHQHLLEFGLPAVYDVAALIHRRGGSLDWERVPVAARSWDCARGAFLALRLSRDLLGAAVPDTTLRDLGAEKFGEEIVRVAARVAIGTSMDPKERAGGLNRLLARRSVKDWISELRGTLFVTPVQISRQYGDRAGRRLRILQILGRGMDLLRRYVPKVWRMKRDPALLSRIRDRGMLRSWLSESRPRRDTARPSAAAGSRRAAGGGQ